MAADLHSRIAVDVHDANWAAEIAFDEVTEVAGWRARTQDGCGITTVGVEEIAVFVAEHDPADAERRYSAALRVLNRHAVGEQSNWSRDRGSYVEPSCDHCELTSNDGDPLYRDWPCPEIRDLAASLGLDITEGSTTDG